MAVSNQIKDRETTPERSRYATPELSNMIELLARDAQALSEPTLGDIRAALLEPHVFWSGEGELLYAQDQTALVIELDELIERYGTQACARDFVERERV